MLDVCLLGTGGMQPLPNRYLTSLYVRCQGDALLIDCGEGTQTAIQELGWGYKDISFLFLTHLHGDHVFGLPGLLSCMTNACKTTPLHIFGPKGTRSIINGLTILNRNPGFPIDVTELDNVARTLPIAKHLIVDVLPVPHSLKCFGYNIRVPRNKEFDPEKAKRNNVPIKLWSRLQKGETVEFDNVTYTPDMVLQKERKGLKVSYITDCRPTAYMPKFVEGADLYIGEAMYFTDDMLDQVIKHKHMLATETAKIAKEGKVKELWLTHYSPAMVGKLVNATAARQIFRNTHLGKDLKQTVIRFED